MIKYRGFSKMWFLVLLLATLVSGCGGNGNNETGGASLVSIEVTPPGSSIAKNTTRQFVATGIYSDNTTKNLTASVTWSSSDTTKASISNTGLATGVGAGSPTIKAISGDVSGSTTVNVTNAFLVSITVTPANPGIAKGTTKQFTATGIFSDNSNQDLTNQVDWSSSNNAMATITNSGLASGAGVGSPVITALSGIISGSTTLNVANSALVSIAVTPANQIVTMGMTKQFTATGIYADDSNQDLSNQVTWSSSAPSIATVSNSGGSKGLATSVAAGSTNITASIGAVSGSKPLTVTAATLASIAVTTSSQNIAKGRTSQFTATGTFSDSSTQDITSAVTWSSTPGSVATVSNAAGSKGLATSVAAGSAIIKATAGTVSATKSLTVSAATLASIAVTTSNPSIAKGLTSQFTATGTFSDSSSQDITSAATWSSSPGSVATISNAAGSFGLATSAAAGAATITATVGTVSGTRTLTVTDTTLSSIAITPLTRVIAPGASQPFIATGTFSDGSTMDISSSVTWSTSPGSVATISNASGSNGLATSTGAKGTTTVSAIDAATKKSGDTTLTVSLSPVNLGTAGNFVILAKTGVSTTGTTAVVGDIGLSPAAATYVTGFGLIADSTNTFSTSSLVTGKIYAADYAPPTPSNMTTAIGDMELAFTDAAGRSLPDHTELGAGDVSGLTLFPGLYKWGTGLLITSAGVTLSGGANDVWIFQIAQDLTVNNSAMITLAGGAQAKNIFWQVSGQATLGTAADFKGILLSKTLISLSTGAVMNGRALAQTAVTLDATAITAP